MSLFVAEINTAKDQAVEAALETINSTLSAIGGEFIESQVTADHNRIFAVLEHENIVNVRAALDEAGLDVEDLAKVRLVGAELEDITWWSGTSPRD
jgi:enamine deaminase RidA (YjgF/YER057c/UK114 family)